MTTSLLDTYVRATASVVREYADTALTLLEGALPRELRGVLYRNGPGKMEVHGEPYRHPFDGDGMVTRFSFEAGAASSSATPETVVRYTNRFVQTAELQAEARAGRMLYRSFGTNLPGGIRKNAFRLHFKNAANTSVVVHAGRLLALWEGGLPHALDPETLETFGLYDFEGALQNRTSRLTRLFAPHLPFSAHPKRDVETGELWNFGALLGRRHQIVLHRVDPSGHARPPRFVPLEALSFVHDFVLTRRFAVFFLPSVAFDVLRTFVGVTTPVASLRGKDESATLLLVPRDGGAPLRVPAPPGFVFHFANGFEDERGHVVLDAMWMPSLPHADEVGRFLAGEEVNLPEAHPLRITVDPATGAVSRDRLANVATELPTIDPRVTGRPYRSFWSIAGAAENASPFLTRVARVEPGAGVASFVDFAPDLPSEPVFVAKPGGSLEEGWVLVLVYRASEHLSELVVLDAETLTSVCRLGLPHHVPPGFHGTWAPAAASP